ncbi:Acetyltransferase (GNAT) family protein [Amycolatopsis saalfeldensis]|uniref:Acetyltransferase (GNAT) family protein n=2 Tax=Amycolatopsis saalfeldensis TaxID=394193 RepID=A0A1H8Q6U5_9PSEU|nr:Acetyltransferase (GNAT) family protein [Amycolatopsis saalfeldensis]
MWRPLIGADAKASERASLAAFDGDVMVGYLKVRYQAFAEEVHRVLLDGGVHLALKPAVDIHKAEKIAGVAELLRSQGFAPIRYFQRMEHPLGELPVEASIPAGLRVEPWSEQNDEDFRWVRNESFKAGLGDAPMPADQWQNKITNQTFRPEVSFLLRDAHFMVVGTLPRYRARGLAGTLIGHALRAATAQGYDRASASVESADRSAAPGVFERAGFTPTMRYVRWTLES